MVVCKNLVSLYGKTITIIKNKQLKKMSKLRNILVNAFIIVFSASAIMAIVTASAIFLGMLYVIVKDLNN